MKEELEKAESNILDSVIQKFKEYSGLQILVEAREILLAPQQRFDALLMIRLGQLEIPFVAEIKNVVEHPEALRNFLANVRRPFLPIIIANVISPKMKEHLRHREVAFLCADGDFFLPLTNIQDQRTRIIARLSEGQINFHSVHGMGYIKLGFAFVRIPQARNMTITELSDNFKMSMGSVSNILRDWEDSHVIRKTREGREIVSLKDFCRRWATAYVDQIKPHRTMFLGAYKSALGPLNKVWRSLNLESLGCWWGGEPGLALLTNELEPEKFILYSNGDLRTIFSKMKLSPAPDGDLVVFRSFWSDFIELVDQRKPFADPLVLYADLIYSGSSRNQKVAESMFDKIIAGPA